MSPPFWAAAHWCQEESGKVRHSFEAVVLVCALLMLPAVLIQDSSLQQDAEDKHREATDRQDQILAELRRVHERLDRLEAGG